MSWPLTTVISGGQTGADQAGLAAAHALGYATGGLMPHGWRTDAGPRPEFAAQYGLRESRFAGYEHRTCRNVLESTATWVFARESENGTVLEGGSNLTVQIARRLGKPYLTIDPFRPPWCLSPTVTAFLQDWVREHRIAVLNIAGNRESRAPGIFDCVYALLLETLKR